MEAETNNTTMGKIERLGELADKLDELERLKRAVHYQAYQIGKLQGHQAREDKIKRVLFLLVAGFVYGLISAAFLER